MAVGAFNVTSRLEEVLTVREGFRAGMMDNSWDGSLPEAGRSSVPTLPRTEGGGSGPNAAALIPAVFLCLLPALTRKKKKQENNENK